MFCTCFQLWFPALLQYIRELLGGSLEVKEEEKRSLSAADFRSCFSGPNRIVCLLFHFHHSYGLFSYHYFAHRSLDFAACPADFHL